MAFPSTLSALDARNIDNPDCVQSVNTLEQTEQPKYLGQAVAFASTVTPDPRLGEVVVIGTLTGPITIANPPTASRQVGRRLTLRWTQDGTGGRVLTFGGDFLTGAAAATTLSKTFTQTFVWDGTNWSALAAPFLLN